MAGRGPSPSSARFGAGALLAVLMFLPAALLVYRGQLSADQAMVRFGLAWLAAIAGVALVSSTLGSAPRPAPVRPPVEGEPAADEPSP